MRIKITLRRPGGSQANLAVTADATTSVGNIADALFAADPENASVSTAGPTTGSLTLQVTGPSGESRLLDPHSNLLDSGFRSGSLVELRQHSTEFAGRERGPAAAVVRVLSGPDAGAEYELPFGSSYLGRERGVDVRLNDPLVSKRHARINVGENVEIIDMNSANGLLMGGQQVARTALTSADVVVLGDTAICVVPLQRLGGAAPSTPVVEFTRSPRVVARYPGAEYPAPAPPQRPQPQRFPLIALVAPLVMGVLLFVFTQSILSVVFIALSPILMVGTYVDHKITTRRQLKDAIAQFTTSLDAFVTGLRSRERVQRAVRLSEAPAVADTIDQALRLDTLLFTHRPEHDSFLTVRLGVGQASSRDKVGLPSANDTLPEYWQQLEEVADTFSRIDGVPVVADLRSAGALGVAGPADARQGVARAIVSQLAGLHSPAEVVICALVSPTSRPTWEWLEWLPHTSSAHSPISGDHLSDNPGSGLALLARLEELVAERTGGVVSLRGGVENPGPKARGGRAEAPAEKPAPLVPSVIVVIEHDAPLDRGRLTRLAERGADADVHIVWSAPSISALPAACRSFVSIDSAGAAPVGAAATAAAAARPVASRLGVTGPVATGPVATGITGAGATGTALAGQVRLGEHTFPVVCELVDAATAHRFAKNLAPVV
ncbi:MAG: cell division protein FtsK, partial [Subtercola sp.]|nr:cell division protein FtsK [Subtercola sp.]